MDEESSGAGAVGGSSSKVFDEALLSCGCVCVDVSVVTGCDSEWRVSCEDLEAEEASGVAARAGVVTAGEGYFGTWLKPNRVRGCEPLMTCDQVKMG